MNTYKVFCVLLLAISSISYSQERGKNTDVVFFTDNQGRTTVSFDGGVTWQATDKREDKQVAKIAKNEKVFVYFSDHRGVQYLSEDAGRTWRPVSPPINVSSKTESSAASEAVGRISFYPHPIPSECHGRFSLSEKSRVTLEVYDMTGNKELTIIDGDYPAGDHDVILNCAMLPAGSYRYKLSIGSSVSGGAIVVVK